MLKIFFITVAMITALTFAAQATETSPASFYAYAHNEGEYTVLLPEAPRVETIWADQPTPIPYLEGAAAAEGAVGEVASFTRVDPETEDYFDVKITFLKADKAFLAGLTQEKMHQAIENDYKDIRLENQNFDFLVGTGGVLKWATLTGFSVDKHDRPFYHAEHYLAGQKSILVVKTQYSVEHKKFEQYYKTLAGSITYRAP